MPIEEIKIGDKVYTTDIETGEIVLREVKQVFETVAEILVYIEVNGEQIKATEYHPFYTKNAGWKDAKELETGDLLVLQTGEVAPIQGIRIEYLEEPIKVYNLEIDEYHVYFVGSSRVLVHNACGDSNEEQPTRRQSFREAKEAAGISKSSQYKTHKFVYDGSTEHRVVFEFIVDNKSIYIVGHYSYKFGRGKHFHFVTDGNPFLKGKYKQGEGHFPEFFGGFK